MDHVDALIGWRQSRHTHQVVNETRIETLPEELRQLLLDMGELLAELQRRVTFIEQNALADVRLTRAS